MYFITVKVQDGCPLFLSRHLKHFIGKLNQQKITPPPFPLRNLILFLEKQSSANGIERLNLLFDEEKKWSFKLKKENKSKKKDLTLGVFPFPFFEEKPHLKKTPFKRMDFLYEARKKGVDDWIFLNAEKQVLETTLANLFWIKENTLYFPHPQLPYYLGVTLSLILEVAEQLGLKIQSSKFSLCDLLKADGVFYCNSMKSLLEVSLIEGQALKKRPDIFKSLKKNLNNLAKEENELWKMHLNH